MWSLAGDEKARDCPKQGDRADAKSVGGGELQEGAGRLSEWGTGAGKALVNKTSPLDADPAGCLPF